MNKIFKIKIFFLTLNFFIYISTKNLEKISLEKFNMIKNYLYLNGSKNEQKYNIFSAYPIAPFLEKNEKKYKNLLNNNVQNGSLIYLNRTSFFKDKKETEKFCIGYFSKKENLFFIKIKYLIYLITDY